MSTLRDRVMGYLTAVAPRGVSSLELSEVLLEPRGNCTQCLNGLRAGNKVERAGRDPQTLEQLYRPREKREEKPAKASRLPMLEPGYGKRRDDCRSYAACLGRFCAAYNREHARCPEACAHYAPFTRGEKLEAGMVRGEREMGGALA